MGVAEEAEVEGGVMSECGKPGSEPAREVAVVAEGKA